MASSAGGVVNVVTLVMFGALIFFTIAPRFAPRLFAALAVMPTGVTQRITVPANVARHLFPPREAGATYRSTPEGAMDLAPLAEPSRFTGEKITCLIEPERGRILVTPAATLGGQQPPLLCARITTERGAIVVRGRYVADMVIVWPLIAYYAATGQLRGIVWLGVVLGLLVIAFVLHARARATIGELAKELASRIDKLVPMATDDDAPPRVSMPARRD